MKLLYTALFLTLSVTASLGQGDAISRWTSIFPNATYTVLTIDMAIPHINSCEALNEKPVLLPADFEAIRPLTFLDHFYFGGSNDLIGLRPVAIAQHFMPDPMLRNLQTFYVRSSIGLKKRTRLVMHCECLVLIKTMSNMTFLLPQLGIRQLF